MTNLYPIRLKKSFVFRIFALKFEPPVPVDHREKRLALLEECRGEVEARIGNFVISGNMLFTAGGTALDEAVVPLAERTLLLKKVRECASEGPEFVHFLKGVVKTMARNIGLVEMCRQSVFLDTKTKERIDSVGFELVSGFELQVCGFQGSPFLRISPLKKVLRN